MAMKLSCTMYLEKFPLDYQICYIKISTCELTLWRPLLLLLLLLLLYNMGTAIKHPVPDRVKPSFVIFDIRALWRSECSDVKNYKWRLNPIWHRMLYSCTDNIPFGNSGRQRVKLLTACSSALLSSYFIDGSAVKRRNSAIANADHTMLARTLGTVSAVAYYVLSLASTLCSKTFHFSVSYTFTLHVPIAYANSLVSRSRNS